MNTIDYFLKVKKEDVSLVYNALERHEGMGAFRCDESMKEGPYRLVKVMVSPQAQEEFERFTKFLEKKVALEVIPAASTN